MSGRNSRYANGAARVRVRRRVLAEETICHLCGHEVDVTLPAGMPDSPELDEIVPVSLGGSPTDRANIRLAHRICNQRRGNRDIDAGPTPAPTPIVRGFADRTWHIDP